METEYTEKELADRNKRWKDHDAYELLCELLWIPDNKRCAVFGVDDFYVHAKKLVEKDEYQYRIQQALAVAKFVNDLKGS